MASLELLATLFHLMQMPMGFLLSLSVSEIERGFAIPQSPFQNKKKIALQWNPT